MTTTNPADYLAAIVSLQAAALESHYSLVEEEVYPTETIPAHTIWAGQYRSTFTFDFGCKITVDYDIHIVGLDRGIDHVEIYVFVANEVSDQPDLADIATAERRDALVANILGLRF